MLNIFTGTKSALRLYNSTKSKQDEGLTSSVTERTPVDAGVLPAMTVKLRRVNKAPKRPGSRQAGRGRTYTRTTIGEK